MKSKTIATMVFMGCMVASGSVFSQAYTLICDSHNKKNPENNDQRLYLIDPAKLTISQINGLAKGEFTRDGNHQGDYTLFLDEFSDYYIRISWVLDGGGGEVERGQYGVVINRLTGDYSRVDTVGQCRKAEAAKF